jgi:hypothetical protein
MTEASQSLSPALTQSIQPGMLHPKKTKMSAEDRLLARAGLDSLLNFIFSWPL